MMMWPKKKFWSESKLLSNHCTQWECVHCWLHIWVWLNIGIGNKCLNGYLQKKLIPDIPMLNSHLRPSTRAWERTLTWWRPAATGQWGWATPGHGSWPGHREKECSSSRSCTPHWSPSPLLRRQKRLQQSIKKKFLTLKFTQTTRTR